MHLSIVPPMTGLMFFIFIGHLTHWPLGDGAVILKVLPPNIDYELSSRAILKKLFPIECHSTLLMFKWTLVQVMVCCLVAPNQCQLRSILPYGVTRPKWVNFLRNNLTPTCSIRELSQSDIVLEKSYLSYNYQIEIYVFKLWFILKNWFTVDHSCKMLWTVKVCLLSVAVMKT